MVRYARDRGMPIAVRGGGHDWAGRSLLDDGVVIDMSLTRRVVVDQGASVATRWTPNSAVSCGCNP